MGAVRILLVAASAILFSGCASKNRPIVQRGWIGGEFRAASIKPSKCMTNALPEAITQRQKSAIRITSLATNTPAQLAGLRAGDLIVEINHEPVMKADELHRRIDRSKPGTLVPVTAYRDGQSVECSVAVGRELYRKGGMFMVVFPTVVHGWNFFWPNPALSLVFVGAEFGLDKRKERDVPDRSAVDLKKFDSNTVPLEQSWRAYLVIMEVQMGKRIVSHELVQPVTAALPGEVAAR